MFTVWSIALERTSIVVLGSPKGGMALMSAAKANAWMLGRDHVLPDDVHQVFVAVAGHRPFLPIQALARDLA